MKLQVSVILVCAAWLTLHVYSPAAEIHSNGQGGGPWSSASSWHGGRVPQASDDVVICMRDNVTFDVADSDAQACQNIYIDPEGVLSFKVAAGDYTLAIGGSVESYGVIKMDASRSLRGHYELRLLTKLNRPSEIRLLENSALLIYGRERQDQPPNVRIAAEPQDQQQVPLILSAKDKVMVDVQHAQLTNVVMQLASLDNTGARGNERLNLIENHLDNLSRIELSQCDTAAVRGNRLERGKAPPGDSAIVVQSSSLADIRENQIGPGYLRGIYTYNDTGSTIIGNTVEGCTIGLEWHGNSGVVKRNRVLNCPTGVALSAGAAAVEEVTVDGSKTAFSVASSNGHQLTSCNVLNLQKGGAALHAEAASVTLLNCNIGHDQVTFGGPPAGGLPYVQTMEYLIVKLREKAVSPKWIEVRTAAASGGVPAGKADLNVRNSPGSVGADRLTPLPATTKSLILRSWKLGPDKARANAPFYDLVVMTPPEKPGGAPRTIHTQMIEPNETWFQNDPQNPRPTLEVSVP